MKWINIKNQQPEPSEDVLLGHLQDDWVDKGSLAYDGNYYRDDDGQVYPTHWSDMPPPPRRIGTHEISRS